MGNVLRRIGKGLIVVLPVIVLIWILSLIFNFLKDIFYFIFGAVDSSIFVTILIILVMFLTLYYAGFLLERQREFILMRLTEYVIKKIPVVKGIYSAIKEIINIFSGEGKAGYLGVASVNIAGIEVLGFITKEEEKYAWVFVPTTPNPTSGFLLQVPHDKMVKTDMSVGEGFKKIISLGVSSGKPDVKS